MVDTGHRPRVQNRPAPKMQSTDHICGSQASITASFPQGDCVNRSWEGKVSICVIQDTEEEVRADPWPAALLWTADPIQLGNGEAKTQSEVTGHEGRRGLA